ncbi:protein NLRC5-like [Schistocerca gregaria]|uniref:protein NLRC5-like n=1 Tax=Schistocerca gregaria TaxID=7010 RepID=UPI00211EB9FC|nr:protein NLRC5-like [Schistocerca gregaria]
MGDREPLWCGNWSQPFEGNGLTKLGVSQTVFEDSIVQVISNPFLKSFCIRKSVQHGKDWELWQKTEGYDEMRSGLVELPDTPSRLLHVASAREEIVFRSSADASIWTRWQQIVGARTRSPVALVVWGSRVWLYFSNIYRKLCYSSTKNGEMWTKVQELKFGPSFRDEETKGLVFTCIGVRDHVVLAASSEGRVCVYKSSDGVTFSRCAMGEPRETNQPVEMAEFAGMLFQARVALNDYLYTRCASVSDLDHWGPWAQSTLKVSSISMCEYDGRLFQAAQGVDNNVYMRFTADGRHWTMWNVYGYEGRKTKNQVSLIVYRNALYQTLVSLDNFVLTRKVTNRKERGDECRVDDRVVVADQQAREDRFSEIVLKGKKTHVQLRNWHGKSNNLAQKLLEKATWLVHLDVSFSYMGNETCSALCRTLLTHASLSTLMLNGNQIMGSVSGLTKLLSESKTLKVVNLASNLLGDEGVNDVALAAKDNGTLEYLDLSDNGARSIGVRGVAEMLCSDSSNLLHFKFSQNAISNDGCQTLAASLENNQKLATLELCDSEISSEGVQAIAKMLANNRSIRKLTFSKQCLKRAESVHSLARALKHNSTLTELDLSRNRLDSQGAILIFASLVENKALEVLDLSYNEIEDEGFLLIPKVLKKNRKLKELVMHHNDFYRFGTVTLAAHLSVSCVQRLDLSSCKLSESGLDALADVLNQSDIRYLALNNCHMETAQIDKLSQVLQKNKKLEHLYLEDNNFKPDDMKHIASLIKSNLHARHLFLWGNPILDALVKPFANAIQVNTHLRTLRIHLSCHDNIEPLVACLAVKQNLVNIQLRGTLARPHVKTLTSLLSNSFYLESLTLHDMKLGDSSIVQLATSLKNNNKLSHLSLTKNNIEQQGLAALAQMLQQNTKLKILDLSQNRLGYNSIELVSEVSLRHPDLNFIVDPPYAPMFRLVHDSLKKESPI